MERYFHHILGEVLFNYSKIADAKFLEGLLVNTRLAGLDVGVSAALDHHVRVNNLSPLAFFIQNSSLQTSTICIGPILTVFDIYGIIESLRLLFAEYEEKQIDLLVLVRKKLTYDGKKEVLQQLDDCLWGELNTKSEPQLRHLVLLCPQLSSRKLEDVRMFFSNYQGIVEGALGPMPASHRLYILENIGDAFLKFSEKETALLCFKQALEIAESKSSSLAVKSNIAMIYKGMANTELAISLYKEIITESDHPNLWFIQANTKLRLGEVYKQQNGLAEAENLFNETLTIYRKALGNYHSETASALGYFGSSLIYRKNWQAAKIIIEESMQIRIKLLGEKHTKTCISYVNYAEVLQELGELDISEFFLEKALAIRLNKFGRNHQDVAYTLSALGNLCTRKAENDKALTFHQEALEIRKLKLGLGHIFTQQSRLALLHIFGQSKNLSAFLQMKEDFINFANVGFSKSENIDELQTKYFN